MGLHESRPLPMHVIRFFGCCLIPSDPFLLAGLNQYPLHRLHLLGRPTCLLHLQASTVSRAPPNAFSSVVTLGMVYLQAMA